MLTLVLDLSGLISPIETRDTRRKVLFAMGISSEFPAVYIEIRFVFSTSISNPFFPLNLYKLGGRIRISYHSLSESLSRAGSSRRPVRSAAPAVRPLRSGCVVVHSWPRPRAGQMDFPARCAGCPAPPATPASQPAARREVSYRHCPPPVAADAELGRAGKLSLE